MARNRYQDEELIGAIRRGGQARASAAKVLYLAHVGLVRKGQRRYRLSEEAALDAYADAIIGLLAQVEKGHFQGKSSLFTYLFRIFSFKCTDRVRQISTQKLSDWTEVFPQLPDPSKDILRALVQAEELEALEQLMDLIGAKCKALLWDSEYWGYLPQELAEKHGFKNAQTAKSQKYKCLQKLRALIRERQMKLG